MGLEAGSFATDGAVRLVVRLRGGYLCGCLGVLIQRWRLSGFKVGNCAVDRAACSEVRLGSGGA